MRRFSLFFALLPLLFLVSCGEKPVGEVQGHAPRVALVPVIDRTHNQEVTWNLASELTTLLCKNLRAKGGADVREAKKVRLVHNPFGEKLEWMSKAFGKADFVVFTELVHHAEEARGSGGPEADADLQMEMRLRLIDLRGKTPRVILQEVVGTTTHLARPFTKWNFYQVPWGKENYHTSPLAAAHARLSDETAERIRTYLRLAISL